MRNAVRVNRQGSNLGRALSGESQQHTESFPSSPFAGVSYFPSPSPEGVLPSVDISQFSGLLCTTQSKNMIYFIGEIYFIIL
jgi:hypothetical protein